MIQLPLFPLEDTYQTLASPAMGEYKDRGSKFIAYAYAVHTEAEIKQHLEQLKKEHFKATHHCYAYRLGLDGLQYRANDDGEPSGTAGKPILNQIDSFNLKNVFIVVVRYYGGTKLGVSGLREAYKMATRAALEQADIQTFIAKVKFELIFDYAQLNEWMAWLKKYEIEVLENNYAEQAHLLLAVRQSHLPSIAEELNQAIKDKGIVARLC